MKVSDDIGRKLLECYDSLGQEDEDQMTNPKCTDCGSEMETGFLVDQRGLGADWHRGVPEPAKFVGLETSAYKIDKTQMLETRTFRCTKCGLLKTYSLEKDSW